ncbi:MAG: cell division protein ZapA [Paludibacteraceae bacterium]|nr:cell division protein ZapA [Paludibacteraceae bacterium]
MPSEKLTISVVLGGRKIQLDINRADEEVYRNAAQRLNEIVSFYRKNYSEVDGEMILLMSAYNAVVNHLAEKKIAKEDLDNLETRFTQLSNELKNCLNEEK